MSGRPKGKDFAAMASRMPSSSEKARAAQLQNDARVAAGLPPLDHPTATTVTRVPPKIPLPKASPRPSVSSHSTSLQAQKPSNIFAPGMASAQQRHSTLNRSGYPSSKPRASNPLSGSTRPTGSPTAPPSTVESRLLLASASRAPLVGPRVQELVRQVDSTYEIDSRAEEHVLELADEFLDKLCQQSLRLAKHRGSKTLDVQDVQWTLSKQWNIVVPGLGLPSCDPPVSVKRRRKSATTKGSKKSPLDQAL